MKVGLERVSKHFGPVVAVADLDLETGDGEFVALLGPSGCGKTTTLLMIAGIYKATSGTIRFGERIVNFLPPKNRNIGMVFQSYALYPHMTAGQNIGFPVRLMKRPQAEIQERVQRVARMLGIEMLLDRKPGDLSGGQQQRVALGRALVKEPDVLLFDEPLSNLDAKLRLRLRGEIKRLHKDLGVTAIYVTHDQVEAMTMADRVAIMNSGRLEAYDTPENLYEHPETLFVAGFIGSPPMNFLEASLTEREDGLYVEGSGVEVRLPERKAALVKGNGAPREVILGIRPEDISVGPQGEVKAEIYVVEPLGREDLVTFRLDGAEVWALAPSPFRGRMGEVLALGWNPAKMHLFDPQTERSLLREG